MIKRSLLSLACVLGALLGACTPLDSKSLDAGDDSAAGDGGGGSNEHPRDAATGDSGGDGDGDGDGDGGGDGDGDGDTMSDAEVPLGDGGPMVTPDGSMPTPAPIVPDDPGVRGPWPVGVRTARLPLGGGMAPAEIWYPAALGSEVGKEKVVYDFIKWLPPEAQDAVPAADKPVPVTCNCYRDLPVDAEHGPFPVVIYSHNVGAFRVSSSGLMEHWASRGFIAIALDHPRLHLQDMLAYASFGACTGSGLTDDASRTRDIAALLAMVRAPSGEFAFLSGFADATQMATAGLLDGAEYSVKAAGEAGVRAIMVWGNPLAVNKSGDLDVIAYFGLDSDRGSTGYTAIKDRASAAAPPSLFIGTDDSGLGSMTELCNAKNTLGRDGMDIAERYSLCSIDYTILRAGWDCSDAYLSQADANHVFGFATAAVLEQYIKGKDHSAAWQTFANEYGEAIIHPAE